MSGILSDAHRDHRVNGHRIEGMADNERPIQLPSDVERYVITWGADGGMYARSKPQFGGPVIYRVLPTSVTAGWALGQRNLIDQADKLGLEHPKYEATDIQIVQGLTLGLFGGVMTMPPVGIEAGQASFEFTITYEVIVPNPEQATWERSPLLFDR